MQEILKKYEGHIMDTETQNALNKPLVDANGMSETTGSFLEKLLEKLEKGGINPHNSQTLYNHDIYDKLSEEEQEAADLTAINLMSLIRQIERLWKLDKSPSFQIRNLVESVFQMKSKFEGLHGDVYII